MLGQGRTTDQERQNDDRSENENGVEYPPTRPHSPRALTLGVAFDMRPAPNEPSHGWNDDNGDDETSPTAVAGATPSNDFGTGVRGGIGYMGLSSAATLLRAIYKFAPVINHGLTLSSGGLNNDQPTSTARSSGKSALSTEILSAPDIRSAPILPAATEISPLVDSYFRYFSQFCLF